uniref:Voltage-dependent calcium channel alpha-2/delta subunit conserved region domain-containing protein n=1 Tax=Ciona savignyi TaxID=51511 RepID=H2ZMZ8_CIOSA
MDEYRDKNFVFIPSNVLAAISPPYADASTGDVIITISTAIVEPLPYNSATDQLPHILGVMGADVTFSYFESLILAAVPECSDATRYCVVIDTSGYVIFDAALSMKEENAMKLALNSNYHIIHSHPQIANYLINENILLRQECADVTTNSFRESYIMNRSRALHADDLPFSISHLSGTNIIIMSIPVDLQQNDDFPIDCVSHLSSNEPCVLPKHGCESPCMEKKRAQFFYDACLNRYQYTWSNDPPPCIPLKYRSNSDKPIKASSDSCDIKPRPADKPSANAADTPIIKEEPFFERNDTFKYIVLFGCVIAFILCLFLAFKQKRRVLVN